MRIKLVLPAWAMQPIHAMGLAQRQMETLRLVHGVITRGKSGVTLDGGTFDIMRRVWGAKIMTDSAETKRRVEQSIRASAYPGMEDDVVLIPGEEEDGG